MRFSEGSVSIWKDEPPLLGEPLTGDLETDVCIVGAGIAGMSVAYELAQVGRQVVVLDDNAIGGGETAQSTAHLSSAIDDQYCMLEQMHGAEGAQIAYRSHDAAITRIEEIVAREAIDCDFTRVDGYLFLAAGDQPALLDHEFEAAHRAGFTDVERLPRAPLTAFDTGPCLRFPRQGQFHPLRYVAGLRDAIARASGRIFTGAHVDKIVSDGPPHVVTSGGQTVKAKAIVVATNTPVNDRVAIHTKQAPYRTFALALELPPDAMEPMLLWDTGDPYHYVRVHRPNERDAFLIVGGEDHETGHRDDARERFSRLEAWTRKRFRAADGVVRKWSGQVLEPADGVAFIGRNPGLRDHPVFIATGDSGHGITHGVIAGLLLRDLVLGRENEWSKLYDPSRKPLHAVKEMAHIALSAASGYAEWIKPAEARITADIDAGKGAIMRRGARKFAVYRAPDGGLEVCSAVCPHLGGIVQWNSAERSWDCPCHGSRFSPTGEVLNGPALHGLKRAKVEDVEPGPRDTVPPGVMETP